MTEDENSAIVDLSEIKGKPVDAVGHMIFFIDFEQSKSTLPIEKIFGLVDMKTNALFKFKFVVSDDKRRNFEFKLTYVSEETIHCKIKLRNHPSAILEHMNIGDELKVFNCKKENVGNVYFGISVLVITTTSTNFARMFNNPSSSDFIVNCQGKQFYVHQRILRERSEYFEAILLMIALRKKTRS